MNLAQKITLTLLQVTLLATPARAETDVITCGYQKNEKGLDACTRLIAKTTNANQLAIYYSNRASIRTYLYDYQKNHLCDPVIKDREEAIKLFPANSLDQIQQLFLLGRTWLECAGDVTKTTDIANIIIEKAPRQPGGYELLASVQQINGDYKSARRNFELTIAKMDNDQAKATAYNSIALSWQSEREFDRALENYAIAIRLDPKEGIYLGNRGVLWRLKGDLNKALLDQTNAIKISPNVGYTPTLLALRGDTHRYRNEYEDAVKDYDDASKMLPNYAPAYTGRGLVYQKIGNFEKAKEEFQRAIASNDPTQDYSASAKQTAVAQLAALESGVTPPEILSAPLVATGTDSIPTPKLSAPILTQPLAIEQAQATAKEGRRVALVIGNSAYQNVPALVNPQKDATAISTSLKNIGFEVVTLANDQTREQMINSLRAFANEAEKSEWAMVYYAGHGMEVGGVNYLIPIDAKIAVDRDIQFEAVPLSQVLNSADTAKKIKLVMLDACRDNPFKPRQTAAPEVVAASMNTAGAPITTRSTNGRGLAEVKLTGATLVVYAAKDGQVALDGEGGNSPFAVAVVQRIATPGVEINKIFRLVRDDVMEATAGRQEPYTYGSLPGKEDFFFVVK